MMRKRDRRVRTVNNFQVVRSENVRFLRSNRNPTVKLAGGCEINSRKRDSERDVISSFGLYEEVFLLLMFICRPVIINI